MRRPRVYYAAERYTDPRQGNDKQGLRFVGQDGSLIYRAGGNKQEIKRILKKLISMYGQEAGIDIYKKYNEALLALTDDYNEEYGDRVFPTASLVLYPNPGKYETKIPTPRRPKADSSVYRREQKLGGGTEKSAPLTPPKKIH